MNPTLDDHRVSIFLSQLIPKLALAKRCKCIESIKLNWTQNIVRNNKLANSEHMWARLTNGNGMTQTNDACLMRSHTMHSGCRCSVFTFSLRLATMCHVVSLPLPPLFPLKPPIKVLGDYFPFVNFIFHCHLSAIKLISVQVFRIKWHCKLANFLQHARTYGGSPCVYAPLARFVSFWFFVSPGYLFYMTMCLRQSNERYV